MMSQYENEVKRKKLGDIEINICSFWIKGKERSCNNHAIRDRQFCGIHNVVNANPTEKYCFFWVERKKRFCKIKPNEGEDFCPEHTPIDTIASNRMACPYDPTHTVYKFKINKHLKICNARPQKLPDYIVKDINSGDANDVQTEDLNRLRLCDLKEEVLSMLLQKISSLYSKYIEEKIMKKHSQHQSMMSEIENPIYGNESRRHLMQTSSLLGILESADQLKRSTTFIEFGAGKGKLAYYLAQCVKTEENTEVLLLDRKSLRHKMDNKVEEKSTVKRLLVDIADFSLDNYDSFQSGNDHVAISKHLCGCATDLTLRCITTSKKYKTKFIAIAVCCHHRCEWRSFVGKKFFQENNLTINDFQIMIKMVSWAVCGTGWSRERNLDTQSKLEEENNKQSEVETPNQNMNLKSLAERENIGFMCKRLLDYARVEFLREHGYETYLCEYVTKDVTLENVCIIANKI